MLRKLLAAGASALALLASTPALATVTNPAVTVTDTATGASNVYNYGFLIPFQADGVTPAVTVQTIAAGVTNTLAPTQYTITGVGDATGGAVTILGTNLAAGSKVVITRSYAYTQTTSVPNTGFYPHTVEQVADKLEYQIQQLSSAQNLPPYVSGLPPLVHATNNTALQQMNVSQVPVVVRDSFANLGDAPPVLYYGSTSPCANPDNGAQVASADAGCWLANFGAGGPDPAEWGVDYTGNNSSDVALVAAATWASTNSQPLVLRGGKVAITGAATVALSNNSLICQGPMPNSNSTGNSGPTGYGGQGTTFLLTSTSVQPFTLQNSVTMRGCNFYWPNQTGTTAGTPISVTASPFTYTAPSNALPAPQFQLVRVLGGTVSVIKVNGVTTGLTSGVFNVPNGQTLQVTYSVAPTMQNWSPIAYPPLFTEVSGHQVDNLELDHVHFINAYDFLSQASNADTFGQIHFTDVTGYAVHNFLTLSSVLETMTIDGLSLDTSLFQLNAIFSSPPFLAQWTGANGSFLTVPNSGGAGGNIAGIFMTGGAIFGYGYGVHILNGGIQGESEYNGTFDAVPTLLKVESGGCIVGTRFQGDYFSYQVANGGNYANPWHGDNQPWISVAGNGCAGGGGFSVDGNLESTLGDVLDVSGTMLNSASLHLNGSGQMGQSLTAGPYFIANINDSLLALDIHGSKFNSNGLIGTSALHGILLSSIYTATIVGNRFNGVFNILDTSTLAGGFVGVVGNVSQTTQSTNSVNGSYQFAYYGGNSFDKVNPLADGALKLGSNIMTSGTPTLGACTGLGTGGSCTLFANSTGLSGYLSITTGTGSPSSVGNIPITLPTTPVHGTVCLANTASIGGASWPTPVTFGSVPSGSTVTFVWTAGAALTTSSTYFVAYHCDQF